MPVQPVTDDLTDKDYIDYAGDGVYVTNNGHDIELRANDPRRPSCVIVLEPYVFESLLRIAHRWEFLTPALLARLGFNLKEK